MHFLPKESVLNWKAKPMTTSEKDFREQHSSFIPIGIPSSFRMKTSLSATLLFMAPLLAKPSLMVLPENDSVCVIQERMLWLKELETTAANT